MPLGHWKAWLQRANFADNLTWRVSISQWRISTYTTSAPSEGLYASLSYLLSAICSSSLVSWCSPATSTEEPNANSLLVAPTTRAASHRFAAVSWPTSGVTPLCVPGGESHGSKWPEWCGFVMLLEAQNQWFIMHHDSFVVPACIGLKTTDQTWHYE